MPGEHGPLPNPNARRRNKREINGRIVTETPRPPRTLAKEARAEWRRIVPELEELGVLAVVDRALLVRYCTVWADWVELNEQIKLTGRVIRAKNGETVRNPLWVERREADMLLFEMGKQLMLSPMSRMRLGIKHEPAEPDADSGIAALDDYRREFGA